MSNYSELKRMAEAVVGDDTNWQPSPATWAYHEALRNPKVVLALIAEVEALQARLECAYGDLHTAEWIITRMREDEIRLDWIEDNYEGSGGGQHFDLRLHIPHDIDEGGLRHAIDAVIAWEADQ